jgi:hypothetical protein
MTPLMGIGSGITAILGDVAERVESAISSIIGLIKQVLNYIYMFMMKLWSAFIDNPKGAITLMANLWAMMV